ncbi:TIGR02444 family protein [Rhodopseudomonas sp. BAL398]|uniref:TIGR02444 family protein n=1 Tax=Rhodopseudomonas sp. BAL398 TaxID=3034676 RepID=UPI000A7E2A4F|nr:TIGR02444 family protein [Rhodopseudomonas sp. BAL398]MDF3811396.1 TIGR02444 family protein [Rhodopseudomonas sp. BAL398]WOK16307.1 TIGR02444 family protein [Rhodopseudomonas sp. BAL398]
MTDDATDIAEACWAFALELYQRPSASAICLKLQAEAGVDVMLLLVAIFAVTRRGLRLSSLDIEEMSAACAPWRDEIVQPLRRVRTTLKAGGSFASGEAIEALRGQIKASELAAERLENDLLARWLAVQPRGAQSASLDDIRNVIGDVVCAAQRRQSAASIDLADDVARLASLADDLI